MAVDCILIPVWIVGIISLIIWVASAYGVYKNLPFKGKPELFNLCLIIGLITAFIAAGCLLQYAPCIMLVK